MMRCDLIYESRNDLIREISLLRSFKEGCDFEALAREYFEACVSEHDGDKGKIAVLKGFRDYIHGLNQFRINLAVNASWLGKDERFPDFFVIEDYREECRKEIEQELQGKRYSFIRGVNALKREFKRYLSEENIMLLEEMSGEAEKETVNADEWKKISSDLFKVPFGNKIDSQKLKGRCFILQNMAQEMMRGMMVMNEKTVIQKRITEKFLKDYEVSDILDMYSEKMKRMNKREEKE